MEETRAGSRLNTVRGRSAIQLCPCHSDHVMDPVAVERSKHPLLTRTRTHMQVAHVCLAHETCPCHTCYCVWRSFHAMFFASLGGNLNTQIHSHVRRSTSFAISLLRRRAPRNAPFPCTWTPRDVSPTSLRHIHGSCASYSLSRLLRDVDGRRRSPARVCDVVSSQVRRRNASRVS